MSKKSELKRKIKESEQEIDELERKRNRSQSVLLQAVVEGITPDPVDVEYFKTFTQLIEVERANIKQLYEELSKLDS